MKDLRDFLKNLFNMYSQEEFASTRLALMVFREVTTRKGSQLGGLK